MDGLLVVGIFGAVCLSSGYWAGAWHAYRHYRLCYQMMKAVEEKERLLESIERDMFAVLENRETEFDTLRKD